MKTKKYVGLDVHKDTIVVAVAEGGREGEVRAYGSITSDLNALEKVLRKLGGADVQLHVVYEAGPTGRPLQRQSQLVGGASPPYGQRDRPAAGVRPRGGRVVTTSARLGGRPWSSPFASLRATPEACRLRAAALRHAALSATRAATQAAPRAVLCVAAPGRLAPPPQDRRPAAQGDRRARRSAAAT